MTLNEYQEQAMTTCMESSNNVGYMFFNLIGEVGELAEKINNNAGDGTLVQLSRICGEFSDIAKKIRKEPDGRMARIYKIVMEPVESLTDGEKVEIQKEAGDILWQLSGLCSVMGWSLEDIAQQNLDKLASRKQRNVIDGNGDNR